MGLLLILDLQPMLNIAQEPVPGRQRVKVAGIHKIKLTPRMRWVG